MVIQKAVDNLKGKPTEDKKAVAGGIAIMVMIILFLGWGFFFIKKIQRGGTDLRIGGGAQDEFNFSSVKQAQEDIMKGFSNEDELRDARQRSGSQTQTGAEFQTVYDQGSADQFGGSGAVE